jgi:hypothetical protein
MTEKKKTYKTLLNARFPSADAEKEEQKQIERRRIKRQLNQTAIERYTDVKNDIASLLDLIGEEMRVHAQGAEAHPKNWGNTGDATNIRTSLKNVLEFLLIGRYSWTETEASRFIEDHLESLREDKR